MIFVVNYVKLLPTWQLLGLLYLKYNARKVVTFKGIMAQNANSLYKYLKFRYKKRVTYQSHSLLIYSFKESIA